MSQNIGIIELPMLYMGGLNLSYVNNTTFTMGAGQCRDSSNSMDIVIGSAPLNGVSVTAPITINTAVNGYNGLDTGTLLASRSYAVYVIADSRYKNPPGAMISLSFTQPQLPNGYDSYRLRDFIATNSSIQIYPFYKIGNGSNVFSYYQNGLVSIVSGGNTAYQTVDASNIFPPVGICYATFLLSYTPAVAGHIASFRPTNASATITSPVIISGVVASVSQTLQASFLLNAGQFDWKTTSGSDDVQLQPYSVMFSV